MLIDGHPQYMGIFGHPLPDSYVASDVEKVEVIRGPGSILYGTNAMGGVINIITKKQTEDGIKGNARLMTGSYNTQKYRFSGGAKKDRFSVFASINHDQTDGHRSHSNFKINNGYAKLGYRFNPHLNLSADFSLAGFNAQDPGPDTLNASFGETIDITRGYWAVSLVNESEKFSGAAKWFYNFGEHNITDGFHSKDRNFGCNVYESLEMFKGNSITVGIDYNNYGGLAENIKAMNGQGTVFADTSLYELGIYGFIQQELAGKLTLNAGLRYNNHKVYGTEWVPSAGFAYKIFPDVTWKGIISKGFRSPTMRELFMWQHNPGLLPENIMNYETGLHYWSAGKRLSLDLTGFIIDGSNLIVLVPNQGYKNTGTIYNKGIEFSLNLNPVKNLQAYLSSSYIHMKEPVYATPEYQLFLSASYKVKKFLFTASLQQVDNLDTDASGAVALQDFTLLSAKTTYRLNKYMQLFVKGENLLNRKYETNRYYTMPGTIVFSGINLAI